MKTVVELESELREEIADVRLRLLEIERQTEGCELEARLLGLDVVRIQGLVDQIKTARQRELEAMRRSLRRAGDLSLEEDGDRQATSSKTHGGTN